MVGDGGRGIAGDKLIDIVAAACPNCGAPARIEAGAERAFCSHCGTQIIVAQKKEVHQHFGEGAGTVAAHLKMANAALAGGNYDSSIGYIDNILKMDPENAEAWMLKGLACRRLCVMRQELRSEPVLNSMGRTMGVTTVTVDVPTYPRANEGAAASTHGIELFEHRSAAASDPTPTLQRLLAYLVLDGEGTAMTYLAGYTQRNPRLLFPYEQLITYNLKSNDLIQVAGWTRAALARGEAAEESQVVRSGRDAVEARIASQQASLAAADAQAQGVRTMQYVSIGLGVLGLILLFTSLSALGFLLLLAAGGVFFVARSKKKGLADPRASLDALKRAWAGA